MASPKAPATLPRKQDEDDTVIARSPLEAEAAVTDRPTNPVRSPDSDIPVGYAPEEYDPTVEVSRELVAKSLRGSGLTARRPFDEGSAQPEKDLSIQSIPPPMPLPAGLHGAPQAARDERPARAQAASSVGPAAEAAPAQPPRATSSRPPVWVYRYTVVCLALTAAGLLVLWYGHAR
jgi:hypothetical protein